MGDWSSLSKRQEESLRGKSRVVRTIRRIGGIVSNEEQDNEIALK